MEPSDERPSTQSSDRDEGRPAVPEIVELLHLQRATAMIAAAVVVVVLLVLSLLAPGVLPANLLTGLLVGVLAVLAGVGAAIVLDGRDPVLRGPRHLRRDGHTVLARMAGPDPVAHGAPLLAALERRLSGRDHLVVALTGNAANPSTLAEALGRGAAAHGHPSLVIDLRVDNTPGIAEVGAKSVRLGEAAQLASDRPYAWIGSGMDRVGAVSAAAAVGSRPPRDLELLLVVAPESTTHADALLQACDRTLLLVEADAQQRAMVGARLDALQRGGARTEVVVVGGVRATEDAPAPMTSVGRDDLFGNPSQSGGDTGRRGDVTTAVGGAGAAAAAAPASAEPGGGSEASPGTSAQDSPTGRDSADRRTVKVVDTPADTAAPATETPPAMETPPATETAPASGEPPAPDADAADSPSSPDAAAEPVTQVIDTSPRSGSTRQTDPDPRGDVAPGQDDPSSTEETASPDPAMADTGPIPPVPAETAADGFEEPDDLQSAVALHQLEQRERDDDET